MSDGMDTNAAVAAQAASLEAGTQLGFAELRAANLLRAREWNPTGKDLGGPFTACELSGEVGEAIETMLAALGMAMASGSICNATKKAERAAAGIAGGVSDRVDLSRELADVVICADLVAMRLRVDLGAAVVEKFNLTSRERGFGTRLDGFGTPREEAFRASAVLYREQRDAMLEILRAAEAAAQRCCEGGIDTELCCMRDEKSAQPAAATEQIARPISEWHEDIGDCLWWRFPIEEPPYVGSPLDEDWPEYHTHFTRIECPSQPAGGAA